MTIQHVNIDALPDALRFAEGETPTIEKTRAMLEALYAAGYSMRGQMIEGELTNMGVFFAQQWVEQATQGGDHATQAPALSAAQLRTLQHLTLDVTWASVTERMGRHSPEAQAVALDALGCLALLGDQLRVLYDRINHVRKGEWQGASCDAFPASIIGCLWTTLQTAERLRNAALQAAQEDQAALLEAQS